LLARYQALTQQSFAPTGSQVGGDEFISWFHDKFKTYTGELRTIARLCNDELQATWGPAVAGDENKIKAACASIVAAAQRLLTLEEDVRSSKAPPEFVPAQKMLVGVPGEHLKDLAKISEGCRSIIASPEGLHTIHIELKVPHELEENCVEVLERCQAEY